MLFLCVNSTRFLRDCQTGQSFLPCLLLEHCKLEQNNQNSLKSCFNSPGWENMTLLNAQESLFGELPRHWLILMSSPNFNINSYISTTVLYTKSYIMLGSPVMECGKILT